MHLFYCLIFTSVAYISLSKSVFENKHILGLLNSLLDDNYITFVTLVSCKHHDGLSPSKFFMPKGVKTKLQMLEQVKDLPSLLKVENNKLAVIVDWQCPGSIQFVTEASKHKLFSRLHFWLILVTSDINDTSGDQKDPLYRALEPLDIPIDSQMTVAHIESRSAVLRDLYRIRTGLPLIFTPGSKWFLEDRFPISPPRDDYGGIIFPTATVLFPGDTLENYLDMRYKHRNSMAKFHYVLVEHIARVLNFRMNVTATDNWGYPINDTNDYDGVIGYLKRGEIEIGSLGLVFKKKRLEFLDFVGETVLYEGGFFFLKPSLSDVSIIYTLPFSTGVWITYAVVILVLSIMLYICLRIEEIINENNHNQRTFYGDVALLAIALVCQEGSSRDPKNAPARIIFFCFLMLTLFLTVSYSAIIVSLLQMTSSAINSLRDLMNSPFKLGMQNVMSITKYVNETSDPNIKDLYFKHLFTQPLHEAFTSTEIGVEKMRTELYAFHGDTDALRRISSTYQEYEKCRLKKIIMFTSLQVSLVARKGSPYGEHIRRTARWLKEAGLIDREYKVWLEQKPKCVGRVDGFASVRLDDFYPVLIIWLGGLGFSILALCFEILIDKLQQFAVLKCCS